MLGLFPYSRWIGYIETMETMETMENIAFFSGDTMEKIPEYFDIWKQ